MRNNKVRRFWIPAFAGTSFGFWILDLPHHTLETAQDGSRLTKLPRLILEGVFAFPPNRETLGGTAYFIVENSGNILVDCPPWERENQSFLQQQGGIRWLFLTHRGAIGKKVQEIQECFGCEVLIQEQEAYLLPDVNLNSFGGDLPLNANLEVIWTPGHSPGSSCLYWHSHGGVLFSGRHLLPNRQGYPTPLRMGKTFHWWRQLNSVAKLRDRFTAETLSYICPGANTGFLRGKGTIHQAYQSLAHLDLEELRWAQIVL